MTYCVGILLKDGMIFASDTRTNAGVDQIAVFRKMYQYGIEGERFLVLQTAGNLATSQAVFSRLENGIKLAQERNLHTVPTLYDAAQLIGECLREVTVHAQTIAQGSSTNFKSSFILGGQIKGHDSEIYFIYPEGNCIRATTDTPFFQLGESKYGKPILDRSLTYESSLQSALRAILISFDSTIRSNLSVGLPIDIMVYHNHTLEKPQGFRITEHDEYFTKIRQHWSDGLKKILTELDESPETYWL